MISREFMNYWQDAFKCSHEWKKAWKKNSFYLKGCLLETFSFQQIDFDFPPKVISMNQHEEAKANEAYWNNVPLMTSSIKLGNCEATTPVPFYDPIYGYSKCNPVIQEKGNNPMRIENTTATAYVTAAKSDDAVSRDYLLSRLAVYDGWRNPKLGELSKFFKLDETGRPQSYLQLIDAIKNDKYTLDDKAVRQLKRLQDDLDADDDFDIDEYGYGPFYGIVFTDLPQPDREGYDAAVKELNTLVKTTKDTIMVKSPADGLTALQALEAWMPTGKAN